VNKVNNLEALYKQRKNFSLHLDSAMKLENFTNKIEEEIGVNLTHSDTVYSIISVLERKINDEIMIEVYADALAHKVLRFNINNIETEKDLMNLVFRIGRNREFFIRLINQVDSIESPFFNVDEMISLIEQFEEFLFKDFEIAVVNIIKKKLSGLGYVETDKIKSIKSLKKYLKNIEKYKEKNEENDKTIKQVDLEQILKEIEDYLKNNEFKIDDLNIGLNDEKGTKQ